MQEEEKMNKAVKIDISKTHEPNYYKKLFLDIINDNISKQKAFFCSLPTNVDLPGLYKTLDQPTLFLEGREIIQALFNGAIICNKPFPFTLFLLDWNNKRAQLNFVSYILENKIDLSSSTGLTKIIKPDYITDTVYYLNSVELFKCIAGINNRSLIMKIKQECPEMCVLGISHVLPKFADIFDDLFLKTIDKYRQLNSMYSGDKSYTGHYTDFKNAFYSYQDPSVTKNSNLFAEPSSIVLQVQREEMKVIEKQSYILNILLIQKKVIHKLSLIPLNVALNLVIENNCFEQVLSLNSELSYNILLLGYQTGLYDLRTILAFRSKNDLFIHNLLVYLLNKNIEFIIPVVNALCMSLNTLKPDTLALYAKLKEKLETHYLFLPFSSLNFNNKLENEIMSDNNEIRTEKYVYPKYIKEKIDYFTQEDVERMENSVKIFYNYRSSTVEKNLESFKNIPKLKKIFKGTIYQRNFVNKLATYFINNLDPFVEEMYEEGLLCENQAKIAAKIISFYKAKKQKTILEIKKKNQTFVTNFGLEALDKDFINTYEHLFKFKLDKFTHEHMFKYICNFLLVRDWLSVVEFCYELKNESFTENFINHLLIIIKSYLNRLNERADKKEKELDYYNVTWFINAGLVLSELVSRKYNFLSIDMFDFKSVIQKSCILVANELMYFICYFFLNSKNRIFTGKLRYIKKVLHEIMAYKDELPFIRINLDLRPIKENDMVEGKSEFNYYLIEETVKRLSYFNEKYSYTSNVKRILADYYEFIYLPSNVVFKSEYLANYSLPDNVYSSIIQMAIDVSVRDICKIFVDRTIITVEKTIHEMQKLYNYKNSHNAFLNLSTRLIHINSYEPLTTCIKNNIINFLKLCNLDINKISITHIIDSNIDLCITLLKREVFTRINNNKYHKEKIIVDGKKLVNVDILNNLVTYEPIIIKELKDEDLEKIKSKLTGITRDIPNTKLYVLTEQWRNFVVALEAYEHYETLDDLDEYHMEESICKFENNNKDLKQTLRELSIKDTVIRSNKLKENKFIGIKYFSELKTRKETVIIQARLLLNLLINSEEVDSLSETLCKHIVGYLQHKILHFMFLFLTEIFTISFYSYLAVKHYLLYSNLPFNKLIYYCIENRIIPVLEFDQLTSLDKKDLSQKSLEDEIQRLKTIVNLLVLRNKKISTIYDFVYTLERISKYNNIGFIDHMVVNLRGFNLTESIEVFEEFVLINKFSFHKKLDFSEFIRDRKAEKIKQLTSLDPAEENSFILRELYNAMNFSWDNFLKYHRKYPEFAFYKLDALIENCTETILLMRVFKDMVESSISIDNLIFFKFINRGLYKFYNRNDKIENFRRMSDESNPFLIFLRGLIQIPQFVLLLFKFSPQSLKYAALVIDLINLAPSLLKYAIVYFTELYVYSSDVENNLYENGRVEMINYEGGVEYKFVTENDKNSYLQSLDKPMVKAKMVMNKEFKYIKGKKEGALICKCKYCEEINHLNPLLLEENDLINKKDYGFKTKRYDLEDSINPFEILSLGCKKYFALFCYLVSPKYPELKNIFMTTYIPNNDSLKKLDYFKIRNLLNKKISAWAYRKYKGYIVAVVDSLANHYFDEIYLIIKENYKVNELINCLQARVSCFNAPICISKAMDIVNMSNIIKY